MREYCLVNETGTVLNMSMRHDDTPPELNDYEYQRGYKWVPVVQVPYHRLTEYRYWNERP